MSASMTLVERNIERVRSKQIKAKLDWSFVLQLDIVIQKRDLSSNIFYSLADEGWIYDPLIDADQLRGSKDIAGWISIENNKTLKRFCASFAKITGIAYKNVIRAVLIQQMVSTLVETDIVNAEFRNITIEMINEYLDDGAKISEDEFNLIFRGGLYGEFTFTAIQQLATIDHGMPKKLSPFPKKPRGKNLSLTLSRSRSSAVNGRRHWSLSEGRHVAVTEKSLDTVRKELMDEWFQKENDGTYAVDPIVLMPIPKEHAILMDNSWYNILILRKWLARGNKTLPHNRRVLTKKELQNIMEHMV